MIGRQGKQRPWCGMSSILIVAAMIIIMFYTYAFFEMGRSNLSPSLPNIWSTLWDSDGGVEEYEQDGENNEPARDLDHFIATEANILHAKDKDVTWKKGVVHRPVLKRYNQDTYPDFIPLLGILDKWNPDNPDPPADFIETIQHFDYSNQAERALAVEYRDANVPFKMYNVPEFDQVSKKWTTEYLGDKLKYSKHIHVEKSKDNHFMYWALKPWKKAKVESQGYVPPTEIITDEMPFEEWLSIAQKADAEHYSVDKNKNIPHYYFMSNAPIHDRRDTFIARDLPMFSSGKRNFFISKPGENKGTQCRFGMRGVISEAHYDTGRNMIVMLKGVKRYILAPPGACEQVQLIPDKDDPSYRHSKLDWSNMTVARDNHFDKTPALDTIVREGEVLFVPSYWLHYIVSLEYSIQCNSRFGPPEDEALFEPIAKCFEESLKNAPDKPPLHEKKPSKRLRQNK